MKINNRSSQISIASWANIGNVKNKKFVSLIYANKSVSQATTVTIFGTHFELLRLLLLIYEVWVYAASMHFSKVSISKDKRSIWVSVCYSLSLERITNSKAASVEQNSAALQTRQSLVQRGHQVMDSHHLSEGFENKQKNYTTDRWKGMKVWYESIRCTNSHSL